MKNKITHFLLMSSFLISAISCSVDEQESSALNLANPVQSSISVFHRYTEREKRLLKENLKGTYKDHPFESSVTLTGSNFIYKNNLYPLYKNKSPYTVLFNNNIARPMLVVNTAYAGDKCYYIICAYNNPTQVIRLSKAYSDVEYTKVVKK